jgi:hypothetical protein
MSSINLRTLLQDNGIGLNETVYFNEEESFLRYPLFQVGDAKLSTASKYAVDFPILQTLECNCDQILQGNGTRQTEAELESCVEKMKAVKQHHGKNPRGYPDDVRQEYEALVCLKKNLVDKVDKGKNEALRAICREFQVSKIDGLKCLKVRGIGICNTLKNVQSMLPQLGGIASITGNIPVFTHRLLPFRKNIERQSSAIEGGPCIIGVDELYLSLQFKDGKKVDYDVMTGSAHGSGNYYGSKTYPLADVVSKNHALVEEVTVRQKRYGLTAQHLIEFYRLMSVAKALDLPLVISLPDHAYKCQFQSLLSPLGKRFDTLERIEAIVDEITNEFVLLINTLQSKFRIKHMEVLYSKNVPLVQCLLQARLGISGKPRRMKIKGVKRDAILDYIAMPSLPHFLWGATNILEVNNVAELESLKGSIENFGQISFGALMFPFVPNVRGCGSMYHSMNDDKLFIRGALF